MTYMIPEARLPIDKLIGEADRRLHAAEQGQHADHNRAAATCILLAGVLRELSALREEIANQRPSGAQ